MSLEMLHPMQILLNFVANYTRTMSSDPVNFPSYPSYPTRDLVRIRMAFVLSIIWIVNSTGEEVHWCKLGSVNLESNTQAIPCTY